MANAKKPRNQMPDGRKRIRVDVGFDPLTGKRIRKTFVGKTLKECYAKRDAWREEQRSPEISGGKTIVAEWIDVWQSTYRHGVSYSVERTTDNACRKLIEAVGRMRLQDVQQLHIQTFANSLGDYSKSTVSKIKQTTNGVFAKAVANGLILRNPCEDVAWPHSGEGTHRFLDLWEINVITRYCGAHFAGTWAMLTFTSFTSFTWAIRRRARNSLHLQGESSLFHASELARILGLTRPNIGVNSPEYWGQLRRSWCHQIEWDDVDFAANVVHVRTGVHFECNTRVIGTPKTASSIRDVPMLPALRLHLLTIPHQCDFVCTGAHGQPVTGSIWTSGWRTYNRTMANIINGDTARPIAPGRRSDLDTAPRKPFDVRAHDLRHTYASMLFEAGVDIKTAQKLLGHATPEITMRIYTHLSSRQEQRSVGELAQYVDRLTEMPLDIPSRS